MINRYLLPLYKDLYGTVFDDQAFQDRLKMQKAIYLLHALGVSVGDYNFSWYKHGPYSQKLLDDMYQSKNTSSEKLYYSEYASNVIEKLKTIINEGNTNDYGMKFWVECLASIHFLKYNVMSSASDQKDVLKRLLELKPHLLNMKLNERAYGLIIDTFN